MNRFTPEERDCYSEDEISLKYLPHSHGYRYEMSNCLFESAFENILKECKCCPGKSSVSLKVFVFFNMHFEKFWEELGVTSRLSFPPLSNLINTFLRLMPS